MSDLDDLDELAALPQAQGRKMRQRWRARGELETHCKRGHELTEDNVKIGRTRAGYILRNCKKCARLRLLCREDS